MEYDVGSLNADLVESALSGIDITSINLDYDSIYSETKSTNYATVKPSLMIEPLDLTDIESLKTSSSNVIDKINEFVNKVREFDNTEIPEGNTPVVPTDPTPEDPQGTGDIDVSDIEELLRH